MIDMGITVNTVAAAAWVCSTAISFGGETCTIGNWTNSVGLYHWIFFFDEVLVSTDGIHVHHAEGTCL